MLIVANSTRSYLSALHVWVALDSKSFSLTRNRFIKDMKTPTLRIVFKKMNLGIVMAEDGSLLDICDCKESAGLKYSPSTTCSMTHPPLFQLIGSADKKTQGSPPPPWSNPLDMVIKYFSPSEEGKGGEKQEGGSHRRTFFKQHHVFFISVYIIFTYLSFVFVFLPVAAWSAGYCSEWSDGLIRDQWCSFCNKIWPGCTTPHFLLGARLTDVMWRWGYPPRSSQLFPG